MRIAVLSRNFASTGGGAERYSVALVEQLAPRHEVHVFAQAIEHDCPGVTYHLVSMPLRRPRWINQLWFASATWLQTRTGFDIVHSHENTWHGNVQTVHVLPIKHTMFAGKEGLALALRWLKVLSSPRLLAYLWLEKKRYVSPGRRRIVLTSHALQKVMQAAYPSVQSAMEVIAPGVTTAPGKCSPVQRAAARQVLGLPALGFGLLLVGNDFAKKGLSAALQALHTLPPEVWLAVVGQGEQDAAMRQQVAALRLGGRVHFLGSLQHMATAYQAADCLVHPTLEDTYAMVVLEALAHGLPVVVSGAAYCGIALDLRDGFDALILKDPQDVATLSAAVLRLHGDVILATKLSVNAQNFAQSRTWGLVAAAYERLFQSEISHV
jgi:glycosyltransferase involved in cell wall biosynthesis